LVSYATYVSGGKLECEKLRQLRRSGDHRGLGWPVYIQAALKKYSLPDFKIGPVVLPTPCKSPISYKILQKDFNVEIEIEEIRVLSLRNMSIWVNLLNIYNIFRRLSGEIVLLSHDAFSLGFLQNLIRVYPKLKKYFDVSGIVAFQHAKPPYRYYKEIKTSMGVRLLSPLMEQVFMRRHYIIDGYIVNNKKTYYYLTKMLKIPREYVLYQHVGIDYDNININFSHKFNIESCKNFIFLYSHVTKRYAGYVKGVDFAGKIARKLRDRGVNICLVVAGKILDRELAQELAADGVKLLGYLPRHEFYKVLASAELFILPARRQYYYGGIGVATIEALAHDIPVVSPVLEHVPREEIIDKLGIRTPWVEPRNIDVFVDAIINALETREYFSPREYSKQIYDIRVMTHNIKHLIYNILNK